MKAKKPLKRHKSIQPLSRDHHQGLLLCWKIRTGFAKGVTPKRIKRYTDWFYEFHIRPHFEIEEKYVFPILGSENEMVKKAVEQHRRLATLFKDQEEIEKSLSLIDEELQEHIRYEERILFQEIQKIATENQLKMVFESHNGQKFSENGEDLFWK